MKNLPLLVGTIVGTLLLIVGVAFLFSKPSTPASTEADMTLLTQDARNIKGSTTPTVTIVEFSDLQCPACRAAQPLVDQIVTQYSDQVQLVFRHFPLITIHRYAQIAAQANEVAGDAGKFWEFHELVFANQTEWSSLGSQDEVIAKFGEYFDQLEIDKTDLAQRIESSNIEQRVNQDSALAQSLGVNATPTFFVNGRQTAAPQLLQTVESLLTPAQQ